VAVKVGQAKVMRTRPIFEEWAASGSLAYNPDLVNAESLRDWQNPSAVDVATNGPGGLILVTLIDPRLQRAVVRRSTDLGATWSAAQPISSLANVQVPPYGIGGHFHHLSYDSISQLFYYCFAWRRHCPAFDFAEVREVNTDFLGQLSLA